MSEAETKRLLGEAVRSWIHMDNLCENHAVQATKAREMRAKHEQDAITYMKALKYDKSSIQVSGAVLELQTKSVASAPTWGFLEKEIVAWSATSGVTPVQTQSLLKWLHAHREVKEVEHLKKQGPGRSKTPHKK